MSLKINSNVGSLITHRHLQKNSDDLSKSLEKLASGLKLNRASDGPANLVFDVAVGLLHALSLIHISEPTRPY